MRSFKVLLLSTGGTIAGQVSSEPGAGPVDHPLQRMSLTEALAPVTEYLSGRLDAPIELDERAICDIDSSDMHPDMWSQLVEAIEANYDDYDAFIIAHGTNTMGYTAAALSFALPNVGKPVILTGSQVPAGLPGTDALLNLQNALRVAAWSPNRLGEVSLQGVLAVFGSHVITGTRVKKTTEFDYDTFTPHARGALGRIGRIIRLDPEALRWHSSFLTTGSHRVAGRRHELIVRDHFDMQIASLTEFPGMSPDLFRSLVTQSGVRGFILRAFGAGDPSTRLRPAFEFLKERQIPIVVTTQAPKGNSNFQVNESGQWLQRNTMAIPAFDMSIESQTVKLAWLLARRAAEEITYSGLCAAMVENMHGEIDVQWEGNIDVVSFRVH